MNAPAIRVQKIGKRYKIGLREQARTTFGEVLLGTLTAPLRRLRALREKPQGEDIFWALRDVSFEVQPGEVVGIIGRNGAGKSTLLKILSRITEPTEGRAEIRGRVRSLLEVGTGFHPELTGRENIYLNGALLGMKKAEIKRKFDEITAFAEVEKFLDTPVKRYSSGMYVRLAFAVAAHLEPEILLIDEVLAVGDAAFQKRCLGKMRDVAGHGRTILFVSHNMSAINQLCTRAIHLSDGKVVDQGEPQAVIERYLASTSLRAQMPIRERSDRTGSGQLKFTGVRLSVGGRDVTCVRSGQDVTVEMTYEAPRPLQPRDARLAFAFSTVTDVKFIAFDTAASQLSLPQIPEHGTLRCRIPRFPLLRGWYKITLFAEINGACADRLEDALHFEVLGGQYPTVGWLTTEHEWDSIRN